MKILALALAALTIAAVPAGAAPAQFSCPATFLAGQPPLLTNAKLAAQARPLCFTAYAVLHSGVTRTPLWSAEHLTRASVTSAVAMEGRSNRFHAEPRLPASERAELADYVRSGFDRGHMAPSGDMPSRAADVESFSLANMVPQARRLNQGSWAKLEGMIRDMALTSGEAYVVTGPLFEGQTIASLKRRVLVPTSTWKAVYVPGQGAAAYIASNQNKPVWTLVPVVELTRRAGLDPFPALDAATKARVAAFPLPTATRQRSHR